MSYAGLSVLYPLGEENSSDEDLETPRSRDASPRRQHNALAHGTAGISDQSPTAASSRDMDTSSLNYCSSSYNGSTPPVTRSLRKLRDDDLEAARLSQEPKVVAADGSQHTPEDELKVKGVLLLIEVGAMASRERETVSIMGGLYSDGQKRRRQGSQLVHEDYICCYLTCRFEVFCILKYCVCTIGCFRRYVSSVGI